MANTVLANLQAAKANLSQLLVIVTLAAQNPTPGNVDAAVTAINSGTYSGALVPRPTYSLDGESYNWAEYMTALLDAQEKIDQAIQRNSLPWIVRSRARP